jgi:hypothetical protein
MKRLFTPLELVSLCAYVAVAPLPMLAQSRLNGIIKSEKDELVVGATVVAIHMRTGTTDAFGNFSIPDMLPGGPFTVQIVQPGFRPRC